MDCLISTRSDEWDVLSQTMLAKGVYFEPRVTARNLSSRFHAGRAVVIDNHIYRGPILAYGAFFRATPRQMSPVYELGCMYWEKGLLEQLVKKIMQRAPQAPIFLITSSRKVMRAIEPYGFLPVTHRKFKGDLAAWARQVGLKDLPGIKDRLPDTVEEYFDYPGDCERWLFMRTP